MVNNQIEFNEKYPKEVKEIKITDKYDFQGQLTIADYPNLERLYLHDNDSIDKITLKNLTQLQECTIWDCGTTELVIDNCSQIKKLNVRKNLLTSLEFLASLENLEELEINGNTKLTENLKPYQGDWKAYRIVELAKQKPQKLLRMIQDLKKEQNESLVEELELSRQKYSLLKKALASFSKEIQKQILKEEITELDNEIKKTEIKTQELMVLKTEELTGGIKISIEKLKKNREEKEVELSELRNRNQELEEGLIKEKEDQLEKLKDKFMEKKLSFFGNKKEKIQRKLRIYLSSVKWRGDEDLKLEGEEARKWLLKGEKENSELTRLLKELRGKQISLLEVKGETIREIKSKEIINISYELKKVNKAETSPDVIHKKQVLNFSDSDANQTESYTYKKSKTRTWNNSFGAEMGASISVKAGIPTLAEGKVVLSPKLNYTHQWSNLESEENTIQSTSGMTVSANSKGEIVITAKRIKINVPFKYTELITYTDGKTEEVIKDGTYESVESYDVSVDLKTEKIVEQTEKIEVPPKGNK